MSDALIYIYGDGGPWISGPPAGDPIPLDDILLNREEKP